MFEKLFGRGDAPAFALPTVRNVTIGRTMKVDPLTWRRYGSDARFTLDRDTLEIVAQGLIALTEGGFVHRFYTDDDVMFQAVSSDREGREVNDITLFVPWKSAYPSGPGNRAMWLRRLRAPSFTDEGLPAYARLWFGPEALEQAPVSFWEDVYDGRHATVDRRIYQTSMLFGRDLPGEGRELLLALEMEPQGGDVSAEIMLGVPLEMGEFSA